MVSDRTRRTLRAWKGGLLIMGVSVITAFVPKALSGEMPSLQNLFSMSTLGVLGLGLILTLLYAIWQTQSSEESSEAIEERVSQLHSELRSHVQSRSYGARSKLIAAPLTELDLDITPRVGLVRDPRLTKPDPISEEAADIVTAFTSSKRRLLIVGEPGSGKTTAAYALIEHLDETEGDERVPLLVNLSAWEAQESLEVFLVDYLLSEVGYQVRERTVASAFIDSRRYTLVLDGLDEIPGRLRKQFSERLDEFVRGLPSEVGVVVTCRTHEYEELLRAHPTGLGLVQAVEMLPLNSQQLDSALGELSKFDKDWETFLTERHLIAYQRVRDLLSNPLFLNLAAAGRLRPGELLECAEEQDLRDLVLERYLDLALAEKSEHEPRDVRRYLTWVAQFLNGAKASPFGLKASDSTVFDLADLTPPDPLRRYRLYCFFGSLVAGLVVGLVLGRNGRQGLGLVFGLFIGLLAGWPYERSAVSSRLTLTWPWIGQQLLSFIGRAWQEFFRRLPRGLLFVLLGGLVFGLLGWLVSWRSGGQGLELVFVLFFFVPSLVLSVVLVRGLLFVLLGGLYEPRSTLITSRSPKEALSRSLFAALIWLVFGLLVGVLVTGVVIGVLDLAPSLGGFATMGMAEMLWEALTLGLVGGLVFGPIIGLGLGLSLGLRNGGWFVLLQKVAHRRLAKAGNLPPRPADFLEWGIERQIFRRVGGGVRFRHSLIQQHLANTSVGELV